MKRIILLVVLIAGAVALVFVYREMRKERDAEAQAEAPVLAPSRVERGPNGDVVLRFDAATQARLGIITTNLQAGSFVPEVTAPARVLDTAGLTSTLNQLRSAEIASAAAKADFERKKKLFDSGQNAAASAVELAEAAMKQQQLATVSARQSLFTGWGMQLATNENIADLANALLRREAALVRVDLPLTERTSVLPQHVALSAGFAATRIVAEVLGPAPTTDSVVPGHSFLCLVTTNAAQFTPGSTLIARVATGGGTNGVVMPRDAIVRHLGVAWTYTKTGADTFARRSVSLEFEHPDGWLLNGEWTEPVVIAGAQSLLSEELKGGIQMKD